MFHALCYFVHDSKIRSLIGVLTQVIIQNPKDIGCATRVSHRYFILVEPRCQR